MVIWNGLGFLVAIIALGSLWAVQALTGTIYGDEAYYQAHTWPKLAGFGLAGVLTSGIGYALNKLRRETGAGTHSFFFIPMDYWGPILFLLGVVYVLRA